MVCEIPRVTVTTWSSKSVILVGPTYRKYLEKALDVVRNNEVASVVGQPGMGKTTLLKKIEEITKSNNLTIYLDLANKQSIDEEFWTKINQFELREKVLPELQKVKGKLGYSFWKKITGVKFEDWLLKICNKYNNLFLRVYCFNYERNFDGMINALRDMKNLGKPVLLVDEIRDYHLSLIHRLINAGLEIPIVMAMPTEAYSKISDLAIRRRIEESRIHLDDALTTEDIKEIVEAYCKDLGENILPIIITLWSSKEITNVSSILQFIRNEMDKVEKVCEKNDVECIRNELRKYTSLRNPEDDAKEFEKKVRDLLSNISKEFGISYVHPRGKRIEIDGKSLVVGLFFIADNQVFLGDVVFSNDGRLHNEEELKLLSKVEEVEHEKKIYKVRGRFIITNINININDIYALNIPTLEVVKILNGDIFLLEERIKILFDQYQTFTRNETESLAL
ncbi:AAA ATPase [Sulfolobus islandicus Y.N.15.51]|jgi:energy-coupling factor transporter ATP-binding protein EcfA2|uniref:AAA ATPase n=1 Tax=Saccharolobus islandicus (strain Y.N.15.51 / Yellowstone \|nr:ATP-binding protein [Sulfolobus islandicus]ACP47346.1 AAA ATPase [Sulfolobus islandicus Y.N.15.51]